MNFARFEMFINELLACFHLLWVHRVDLGYFWYESFLEVNGVVEGISWGEFSVLGLVKDFGVFGVLWGKFLLHLLHCLSQCGRKHKLSDVWVFLPQYPSECHLISLLGIDPQGELILVFFHCLDVS